MSDESGSDNDMDSGNVEEGASIRVVQSSMHASIKQNSLFKVVENNKEEEEKDSEGDKAKSAQSPEKAPAEPDIAPATSKSPELNATPQEVLEPKITSEIKLAPEKSSFKVDTNKKIISAHLQDIFNEKKKPQGKQPDVEKRFYEYQNKLNKKIEEMKKDLAVHEDEICTFQPKTTVGKEQERKFSHFLSHMQMVEKSKKDNLERKVNQKAEEEDPSKNPFKPTLSKKTIKLASKNKSAGDLHKKLYNESSELKKKKEADSQALLDQMCSFKPAVNKKSAELKREGQVNQRLYEQALNKQPKKSLEKEDPTPKPEKLISDESENIIREKFIKEINEKIPKSEGKPDETIDFTGFSGFLERMNCIHSDKSYAKYNDEQEICKKAWTHLCGGKVEPKIETSKLQDFLLSVMKLSKHASKKLYSDFQIFSENSRSGCNEPKQPQGASFSFKPRLNPVSEKLAVSVKSKRLNTYLNAKPEKVLNLIEIEAKEKLEEKRKKEANTLPSECTFKPVTRRGPLMQPEECNNECNSISSDYLKLITEKKQHRADLLYNYSKIEQEKKERMMRTLEDAEIEQNMTECTFTPCLEKKIKEKDDGNKVKRLIKKLKDKNPKNFHELSEDTRKEMMGMKKDYKHLDKASQDFVAETIHQLMKMDTLRSYYKEDICEEVEANEVVKD